MTEEDAFALLRSKRPNDRLRGARLLAAQGDASILAQVRQIRQQETDSWVQVALDGVVRRLQEQGAVVEEGGAWISFPGDPALEDVRAKAIETVTRVLLHEVRSQLRDITEAAMSDLGVGFADSPTDRKIARLREFLATVRQLHDAAGAPRFHEFDLSDLVARVISDSGYTNERVLSTRTDPVIAIGDPDLLALALVNVVRNAVEATESPDERVVINCAATDNEAWVVVLDDGVGLPPGFENAANPGETTKSKAEHFGWGLTIAQRAVHSIGGQLRLTPREGGGTSCEIRWSQIPKGSDLESTAG